MKFTKEEEETIWKLIAKREDEIYYEMNESFSNKRYVAAQKEQDILNIIKEKILFD